MELSKRTSLGYFFALFTVAVWGTTFIASKQLLTVYTPARIMKFRVPVSALSVFCVKKL